MEGRWRRGVEEEKWDDSREERREEKEGVSHQVTLFFFILDGKKKMHQKCTKGKNLIYLHQFIQYFSKQYIL